MMISFFAGMLTFYAIQSLYYYINLKLACNHEYISIFTTHTGQRIEQCQKCKKKLSLIGL